MRLGKQYELKVYDKTGTSYVGVLGDVSNYSFSKTINGGIGELTFELPRKFDDFGEGEDIDFCNEVQVWVADDDAPDGVKIYSGYIAEYEPNITGGTESVYVRVLGFVSRLGFTVYRSGVDVSISHSAQDPEGIVQDIIDTYRSTVADERINYSGTSTDTVGHNISLDFNTTYVIEAIEQARDGAGGDFWWYVDADNIFYFKDKPASATHQFVFGKDVVGLRTIKSVDDVKNHLFLWNGLQPEDANYYANIYYSAASYPLYWRRDEVVSNPNAVYEATGDEIGDAFIDAFKNPNTGIEFVVKDNNFGQGYDIESIEPGDTCQILNIDENNVFSDNMQITQVDYTPEQVTIRVDDKRALTARRLTDLNRNLQRHVEADGAPTYVNNPLA